MPGGIEVAGRAPFAEALGLLAVRAHPVTPGGERVRLHGTEGIGHVPGVCPTRHSVRNADAARRAGGIGLPGQPASESGR